MAAKEVRNKKKGRSSEWSKSGSFMNKPDRGWIHPDFQLDKEAGICYGVRVSWTVGVISDGLRNFKTRDVDRGFIVYGFRSRCLLLRLCDMWIMCETRHIKTARLYVHIQDKIPILWEATIKTLGCIRIQIIVILQCVADWVCVILTFIERQAIN